MNYQKRKQGRTPRLLAAAIIVVVSVTSCGIEEPEILAPKAPGNPYLQTIAYGGYVGLGGLVLVSPDGTQRRLVGSDDSIASVAWAPGKRSLAYVRIRDFLLGHIIKVVSADGSSSVDVAEGIRNADLSPGCWSPNGSRLVFEGGPNNLIVISAQTGALDFFLPGAIGGSFVTDSTVVCQLIQNDNVDSTIVVLVNVNSGLVLGMAHAPGGTYFLPRVSPSRDKIAYVYAPSGDAEQSNEIWLMNADGTGQRRLASGGAEFLGGRVMQLKFSPDGHQMLFVPDWDFLTRVHVLDIVTGNAHELPDATTLEWANCDWSPQSDRIVFSHRNGGICVINEDGTGLTRLDRIGEDPAW